VHALLARAEGSKTRRLKNRIQSFSDLILHARQFFTSPTLPLKPRQNWKNAKAEDLPNPLLKTDFAKNETCQKKNEPDKKPEPNLLKLLLKKCSRFHPQGAVPKPDFVENGCLRQKQI
jgi:hypothetical protein